MRQWWLMMALLLSVGINIGILVGRGSGRAADEAAATDRETPEPPPGTPEGPPDGDPRAAARGLAPRFVYRMADELGLRGELRDAFIDRQRRFLDDTVAARIRFSKLQGELRHELIGLDPDRRAAEALLDELGAAHAQLERVFVDNLFDTRELLDPEQQRRYLRFLQRFRHARDGQALRRLRDQLEGRAGPPPDRRGPWPGRDRER